MSMFDNLSPGTKAALDQHLTVQTNMARMLGHPEISERDCDLMRNAYLSGVMRGRTGAATGGDDLAIELARELAILHILIDWSEDDTDTRDRIAELLARADGAAQGKPINDRTGLHAHKEGE